MSSNSYTPKTTLILVAHYQTLSRHGEKVPSTFYMAITIDISICARTFYISLSTITIIGTPSTFMRLLWFECLKTNPFKKRHFGNKASDHSAAERIYL